MSVYNRDNYHTSSKEPIPYRSRIKKLSIHFDGQIRICIFVVYTRPIGQNLFVLLLIRPEILLMDLNPD